jgi:hypothetical protein
MRSAARRLTFQLVSLFDLLIIIVFAQFFDLQDKSRQEADAARRQSAAEERLLGNQGGLAAMLREDLDRLAKEQQAAQSQFDRQLAEAREEVDRSRAELQKLARQTALYFELPEEQIKRLLEARDPEDAARLREQLKQLASAHGAQAVRHILTLAELEKRCDIWQIHIRDDGSFVFEFGERTHRFRAESAEKFSAELFRHYRNLPQPKNLVMIMLSWGDAELKARGAAIEGIEQSTERLRADTDRRTRFEYAILGYLPQAAGEARE